MIKALDRNLLPWANGWGERLVRHRTTLGLSQKELARRIGVDSSTLARWESGEREQGGVSMSRVKRLLDGGETASGSDARLAG